MAPGIVVAAAAEQEWVALPFFLVASYLATFATIYFNVALTGAAVKSMDGKDTNLQDGLAIARERRGLIAKWALVQWAVGLLIRVLQNAGDRGGVGQLVSALVSGLVGAAWAIASFFVVPVLALEGLGPKDALKRSIAVIRERWGEGIVGHADHRRRRVPDRRPARAGRGRPGLRELRLGARARRRADRHRRGGADRASA